MNRFAPVLSATLVLTSPWLTPAQADSERKTKAMAIVNHLEAEFTVLTPAIPAASSFAAQVVMTNRSPSILRLNARLLDMSQLLLKVQTIDGKPVHPGPPGMPRKDDGETGRVKMHPGQALTFRYTGSDYFGSELPPGRCQVRFVYRNLLPGNGDWTGAIEAPWLDFEVLPRRR